MIAIYGMDGAMPGRCAVCGSWAPVCGPWTLVVVGDLEGYRLYQVGIPCLGDIALYGEIDGFYDGSPYIDLRFDDLRRIPLPYGREPDGYQRLGSQPLPVRNLVADWNDKERGVWQLWQLGKSIDNGKEYGNAV